MDIQQAAKTWFADKDLTANWLGSNLEHWAEPLRPWHDQPCEVLEIGSDEGRSAIAFLEYLPLCRLTAIDVFVEAEVERRFDANMARYPGRVTKMKARAIPAMDQLLKDGRTFDVIYLDTGKSKAVSFANSALAWPLLRTGGVFIWDDLTWGADRPEDERPGAGIGLFASLFGDCLDVAHEGQQLIVRKTAAWPLRQS